MTVRILEGDVRDRLRELPTESVHCCVTSPPYWSLRDYGVEGQLGLEETPEEYVEKMVEVFREVWRVLRDDGTCWINMGDSYANDTKWGGSTGGKHAKALHGAIAIPRSRKNTGLKPKDLVGIPWMLAFALRADGWYLRSDIIWHKPNPMPESVTDRPTKSHEYLFLLTKKAKYYYDADAVREDSIYPEDNRKARSNGRHKRYPTEEMAGIREGSAVYAKRNLRSVWTIATAPFKEAHFAAFPPKLIEPCIKAGTSAKGVCAACGAPWERVVKKDFQPQEDVSEAKGVRGAEDQKPMDESNTWEGFPRGTTNTETTGWKPTCKCNAAVMPATVLDPFSGAGTTCLVADRLGRDAIGIELNPEYAAMSRNRIHDDAPLFAGPS